MTTDKNLDYVVLYTLRTALRTAPHAYRALNICTAATVHAGSSDAEIRTAWLASVRLYHPDRAAQSSTPTACSGLLHDITAALNTAYASVCTAKARTTYTKQLRGYSYQTCQTCLGKGHARTKAQDAAGRIKYVNTQCAACGGAGVTSRGRK